MKRYGKRPFRGIVRTYEPKVLSPCSQNTYVRFRGFIEPSLLAETTRPSVEVIYTGGREWARSFSMKGDYIYGNVLTLATASYILPNIMSCQAATCENDKNALTYFYESIFLYICHVEYSPRQINRTSSPKYLDKKKSDSDAARWFILFTRSPTRLLLLSS